MCLSLRNNQREKRKMTTAGSSSMLRMTCYSAPRFPPGLENPAPFQRRGFLGSGSEGRREPRTCEETAGLGKVLTKPDQYFAMLSADAFLFRPVPLVRPGP